MCPLVTLKKILITLGHFSVNLNISFLVTVLKIMCLFTKYHRRIESINIQ